MGLISRSFDFVNGTVADGDQVDTDINKVYTEINGNLDNDNIKPSAGIDGSKLAAGSVTVTQLANDSVDNNKLKDDAAVDANRAVTRDHIRNSAINSSKVLAASVGQDRLFTTTVVLAVSPGFASITVDSTVIKADYIPLAVWAEIVNLAALHPTVFDDGTANWKIRIDGTGGAGFGPVNLNAVFLKRVGI